MEKSERIMGGIMGVVVGDALGLPVQFLTREEVRKNPVTGMRGYGTFRLPPGSWSDDSSLTLCLAESLTRCRGFDMIDVAESFVNWLRAGYMTPYGYAYDIGNTTYEAVMNMSHWLAQGKTRPQEQLFGPGGERDNGNGALMRILPGILFYERHMGADLHRFMEIAKIQVEIAAMTHSHPISVQACGIYGAIVTDLLEGVSPEQACRFHGLNESAREAVRIEFQRVMSGKLKDIPENEIRSTGYVVDSLEAAIWCFLRHDNYQDTVLEAVNLGGDTDTIAAIAGGLAGVAYGIGNIPREWISALTKSEMVRYVADNFTKACLQA